LITFVGIIHSWVFYRQFGINVFDYAELVDFLLAGLKNPILINIIVGGYFLIVFVLGSFTPDDYRQRRYFVLSVFFVYGVTPLVLIYSLASLQAEEIKHGEPPSVAVRYSSSSGAADQVTEPELALIGATQKVVFFYDGNDNHTLIIPQSQIVSIEVPD
jgi:hypothetical protein